MVIKMNEFNEEMIKDYADKLLIGLTDEETKTILSEFEVIKKEMDLITKIDGIENVEPMHFPFIVEPTPRDGKVVENEDIKDILKNSGRVDDREIEVPKVVG